MYKGSFDHANVYGDGGCYYMNIGSKFCVVINFENEHWILHPFQQVSITVNYDDEHISRWVMTFADERSSVSPLIFAFTRAEEFAFVDRHHQLFLSLHGWVKDW